MAFESDKRIRWACRRGMLELDLFLLPFFDEQYETLSPEEKSLFQALLSNTDQTLQAWLLRQQSPEDKATTDLISKIIRHAEAKHQP